MNNPYIPINNPMFQNVPNHQPDIFVTPPAMSWARYQSRADFTSNSPSMGAERMSWLMSSSLGATGDPPKNVPGRSFGEKLQTYQTMG
jgi:hypothetical protein